MSQITAAPARPDASLDPVEIGEEGRQLLAEALSFAEQAHEFAARIVAHERRVEAGYPRHVDQAVDEALFAYWLNLASATDITGVLLVASEYLVSFHGAEWPHGEPLPTPAELRDRVRPIM